MLCVSECASMIVPAAETLREDILPSRICPTPGALDSYFEELDFDCVASTACGAPLS